MLDTRVSNFLRRRPGFSLIELLVTMGIFSMISVALASAFLTNAETIYFSRLKAEANSIANDKIEELRNMAYSELATQNGPIIPPGNLLDQQTVVRGNGTFIINLLIEPHDEPSDGLFPTDTDPFDNKRIQVTVLTPNRPAALAVLATTVSASSVAANPGSGVMTIQTIDSQGNPVPNVTVSVKTNNPLTSIVSSTKNDGRLTLAGLLSNILPDRYHIELTKANYNYQSPLCGAPPPQSCSAGTASSVPGVPPNRHLCPTDQDVVQGSVTVVPAFTLGVVGRLRVQVVNQSGQPVEGAPVTIQAGCWYDQMSPKLTIDLTQTSDPTGRVDFNQLPPDSTYLLTVGGGYIRQSVSPYHLIVLKGGQTVDVTTQVTTSATAPVIGVSDPFTNQTEPFSPLAETNSPSNTAVAVRVFGDNFDPNVSVQLKKTGQPAILLSQITVSGGNEINGQMNLSQLPAEAYGEWDIEVENPSGEKVIQYRGFCLWDGVNQSLCPTILPN